MCVWAGGEMGGGQKGRGQCNVVVAGGGRGRGGLNGNMCESSGSCPDKRMTFRVP